MVGEIRDFETAKVAFEFASTGRPVLSTVHTNSAAGAIQRLRDMGIEPYVLAATLKAVIAQRLVRKLCEHCREPHTTSAPEEFEHVRPDARLTPRSFWRPVWLHSLRTIPAIMAGSGSTSLISVNSGLRDLIRADGSEDDDSEYGICRA